MTVLWQYVKMIAKATLPQQTYCNLAWWQRARQFRHNKRKIEGIFDTFDDDCSRKILNAYLKMHLTNDYTDILSLTKPKEELYFDKSVFTLGNHETFVDMGVLDAENSLQFAKSVHYQYDNILLFEPDPKSYERSSKIIQDVDLKRAYIFPEGCSDCNESLFFEASGGAASRISQNGKGILVKMVSLDSRLQELEESMGGIDNITYIKMDIEGGENKALIGSVETIRKYRPKLAVSLYHKPEDIFTLPILIKSILPDYKLYIRHYNSSDVNQDTPANEARRLLLCELVCYAI